MKSRKSALKKAIGETILTPMELYTCLLEVANLLNQPTALIYAQMIFFYEEQQTHAVP